MTCGFLSAQGGRLSFSPKFAFLCQLLLYTRFHESKANKENLGDTRKKTNSTDYWRKGETDKKKAQVKQGGAGRTGTGKPQPSKETRI